MRIIITVDRSISTGASRTVVPQGSKSFEVEVPELVAEEIRTAHQSLRLPREHVKVTCRLEDHASESA